MEMVSLQNSGTFSMVARCPKTMALGVCVSSASLAVGSRVPHAEAGVGAIATQAYTSVLYGIEGLKLLKKGFSPKRALGAMLHDDPERELRQVIVIDKFGRTAAFTGKEALDWKGHLIGEGYVVAGNMLVGGEVIEAMAEVFEGSVGALAERLMEALEAGQEAGGDRRGRISAALLVVGEEQTGIPVLDLRIDNHQEPVRELRKIFENYRMKKLDQNSIMR